MKKETDRRVRAAKIYRELSEDERRKLLRAMRQWRAMQASNDKGSGRKLSDSE